MLIGGNQILLPRRRLAIGRNRGGLQRLGQRDLLRVAAGEGGFQLVHHALLQALHVGGADFLQEWRQQPAATPQAMPTLRAISVGLRSRLPYR